MTHQLMLSAKKKWRKLDGQNLLPEIIQGVDFRDGIKHEIKPARPDRHQLSGIPLALEKSGLAANGKPGQKLKQEVTLCQTWDRTYIYGKICQAVAVDIPCNETIRVAKLTGDRRKLS